MRKFAIAIAGALALMTGLEAQITVGAATPSAAFKSAAEIDTALAALGAVSKTGAAVTVYPGITVRRRSAGDEPQYAIIHPLSIEIYQITDGTATLVTGGSLTLPLSDSADDLVRSTSITGGEARKVAKGDVVVLPPGTAHWFSDINGTITYLEARVQVKK